MKGSEKKLNKNVFPNSASSVISTIGRNPHTDSDYGKQEDSLLNYAMTMLDERLLF